MNNGRIHSRAPAARRKEALAEDFSGERFDIGREKKLFHSRPPAHRWLAKMTARRQQNFTSGGGF